MNRKIEVICPDNNLQEKTYIIKVLFSFLSIDVDIIVRDNVEDYIIVTPQGEIVIEDHFFNRFQKELDYLQKDNIPSHLEWFKVDKDKLLPVIFGRNFLSKAVNDTIICGLDIFASSFFMLTRWEEFLLGREENGFCDEEMLFCVKNNIFTRPIVNEYCVLLEKLLFEKGISIKSNHKFSIKLTHDVDRMYLTSWNQLAVNLGKLLKNKQYKKTWHIFFAYIYYKLFNREPFNSFEEIMNLSEKLGLKNFFYFKACEKNEKGYTYDVNEIFVIKTLKKILDRGHYIGFHPSENTFRNGDQFKKELYRLQSAIPNNKIVEGRNHGLYCNSQMLKQWENAEIKFVSNYGFQNRNGFRCGICYPFPVFDIFSRQKLSFEEIPFVAMDTTVMRTKEKPEVFYENINNIIDEIYKYRGVFCGNWHTNVLNMVEMRHYKNNYIKLLNYIKNAMD